MPAHEKGRRSSGKPTMIVTLRVSADKLRNIVDPSSIKADTPTKESPVPEVSTPAPEAAAPTPNGENASDSAPGTPSSQAVMAPPSDTLKKKGVKRGAAGANGNELVAKVRGKPGPKKKQKLDDGEPGRGNAAYHKLGPKANQGAINAGLRALDRSGTPCRKWQKGGFTMKSFTGVVWGVPRWTAPSKPKPEGESQDSAAASVESSNKENKEESQPKSEQSNSNAGGETQMDISKPPSVRIDSPAAATPIAAAS